MVCNFAAIELVQLIEYIIFLNVIIILEGGALVVVALVAARVTSSKRAT